MQEKNNRSVRGMRLGFLKGKRHILLVAVVLMIIALVVLHVRGRHPLAYLMVAGFVVVVVFKLSFCGDSRRASEHISRNNQLGGFFPSRACTFLTASQCEAKSQALAKPAPDPPASSVKGLRFAPMNATTRRP